MYYQYTYEATTDNDVQGSMLKYCKSLKKLIISDGNFYKHSVDAFGEMTNLEVLELDGATFNNDHDFSSLNNLNNLTTLKIYCNEYNTYKNIKFNFIALARLKILNISKCLTTITTI